MVVKKTFHNQRTLMQRVITNFYDEHDIGQIVSPKPNRCLR